MANNSFGGSYVLECDRSHALRLGVTRNALLRQQFRLAGSCFITDLYFRNRVEKGVVEADDGRIDFLHYAESLRADETSMAATTRASVHTGKILIGLLRQRCQANGPQPIEASTYCPALHDYGTN